MGKPDYYWALECWREARAKYLKGRPLSADAPIPFAAPDEVGCWYENCTIPHCDCEDRARATMEASNE